MRRARGPHRIYHRIYLHGLALLALVALSLALFGWLFGRESRWHRHPDRLARHVAGLLAPLPDAALAREVERLGAELDLALAVYAQDGRALARSGTRPLAPLPAGPAALVVAQPTRVHRQHLDASIAAGPGRYLRLSLRQSGHDLFTGALAGLALVVLVLALASAPLARALARPIERLAETARRLGEGDLQARTGLRGGDELGALAQAFDEMADRIQRQMAAEKALLANVSHELRTPLARLRVTLGLAAEAEPERARAYLLEMEGDLAELDHLVGDILAAARLEAVGAQALQPAPVEPQELVRDALARLAPAAPGADGRGPPRGDRAPRGRRWPAGARARQPARQRRQVLGSRDADRAAPGAGRREPAPGDPGPRPRHRARGPGAPLHAVLPGRPEPRPGHGRRGTRPRAVPARRRGPRWPHRRRELHRARGRPSRSSCP